MKKIVLISIVLIMSMNTYSQAKLGVRGGLNLANLTNLESEYSTKGYFGVLLGIKISESYTLRPEFTYSKQGATMSSAEIEIPVDDFESEYLIENNGTDINIDFLTLSVINKITTTSNISFLAGPFVSFRINDNLNDEWFFVDVFPRMDIGLIAGLSYDVSKNISIEARFKRGLTDLVHEEDLSQRHDRRVYTGDQSNHSQTIQFGITYKLELKK